MKRRKGRSVRRLLLQLLLGMVLLTVGGAMLAAWLIRRGSLELQLQQPLSLGIRGLAAAILALYAAIRSPQKKALWGMGAALAYALALALGNLLFFAEPYRGLGAGLGACLLGGLLGSLLGGLRRKGYA